MIICLACWPCLQEILLTMVTWKCSSSLEWWCGKETFYTRVKADLVRVQWYWVTMLLCSPGEAVPHKARWACLQLGLKFFYLLVEKLDTCLGSVVNHCWHSILLCYIFPHGECHGGVLSSFSGNSMISVSFFSASLNLKDFVCLVIHCFLPCGWRT